MKIRDKRTRWFNVFSQNNLCVRKIGNGTKQYIYLYIYIQSEK